VTDQTATTWADPNPPSTTDPAAKTVLTIAGAVLTLLVMATLVVVVIAERGTIFGGSRDNTIVLVAANAQTANSFTPPMFIARSPVSHQAAEAIQTVTQQFPAAPDRGARLVSGAHPGLYGASPEGNSCDAAALANYLDLRPNTAAAWAEPFGIQPGQIPYYLNALTPVVLTTDTWVTLNQFSGGRRAPTQALLQAGNAVMIDRAGVPRLHCASGDPLQPPADKNLEKLRLVGQAWPGFELQNVVAVAYTDAPASFTDPVPKAPIDVFKLVNLSTGEELTPLIGGTIALPPELGAMLPDPIAMNVPSDSRTTRR
jgi:hypothetical protein